ncbi:MAG: hypothetical protein HYY63_00585, partial [Elusimicrobia bacterium]|nr:hypothetical protein [Elusimicrobiota bacterium]
MIQFWVEKKYRFWLRLTGTLVVASFLFTTLSAPFVQASFWEERRRSVEDLKKSKIPLQLASAAGVASLQSVIGNGIVVPGGMDPSLVPSPQSQITPEFLERVAQRSRQRLGKKKKDTGIPADLIERIERYGDIERIHLVPSQQLSWSHSEAMPKPLSLQLNKEAAFPSKGRECDFVTSSRWKLGQNLHSQSPLVIQIQNAHDIYSVQRNVALLLKELMECGVELVGVEGSEGILQGIEKWRKYPKRDILMGVAGFLMREGSLTGVEIAGLARKNENVEFYGVEEKEPYLEQVKSFKETLNNSKEVEIWKEGIGKKIESLKEKFYSVELKELDKQQKKYEEGDLKLGEWIEVLGDSKQPNISKYLQAHRLEKSLNFKQVESDQKKLLETLSKKLKREDLVELLEESLAYRLGRIGYGEFYEGLKDRCRKSGVILTPEMEHYIGYITLVEGIDREKLFKELKSLEDEAWRMKGTPYLIPSSQPQKDSVDGIKYGVPLIQMDRDYKLLVKALDFSVSPEDWEEYGRREKEIGEVVKGSVAEPLLENVARFNQLSHRRNQIFVEKLRKRMEEKK